MKQPYILVTVLIVCSIFLGSCMQQLESPSQIIKASDLTGKWIAHYGGWGVDTIYLKNDGTFKQVYQENKQNYSFETPWNHWEVVRLPNVIRIRLQGARYYLEGKEVGENNGIGDPTCHSNIPADCAGWLSPWEFYDPYTDELVQMVNILLLDVRVNESGNLILHHLWMSSDEGFPRIGGNEEIFYRITSP